MDLYLIELTVADLALSLPWYRDRFGLSVERLDEANGYALLAAGPCKLALKQGQPSPGSAKFVFRVDHLEATLQRLAIHNIAPSGPLKTSEEGYRSAKFVDPDGYRLEMFEWVEVRDLD